MKILKKLIKAGKEIKMSNIYELTSNYEHLLNMLYDEDVDEQAILDTLESIEGDIEDKADGYAKIIKELEAKQKFIKKYSEEKFIKEFGR